VKGNRITFLTTGSIEEIATAKRALGMAGHLTDLGWEVSIILMDCEANRKRVLLECDERITIRYYATCSTIREVRSKSRILRSLDPDIVYICSFTMRNMVFRSTHRRGMRIVIEHSELSSEIRVHSFFRRRLAAFFEMRSLRHADHLVCASKYLFHHFTHLKFLRGKPGLPVIYLPYAFSEGSAVRDLAFDRRLKTTYHDRINVVYVGSLVHNYGLFVMLEAMRRVRAENPGIVLHMLGNGDDRQAAEKFVQAHGLEEQVKIAGYVKDEHLPSYFSLADAFLTPLNNTIQDWARCPSKTYLYLPYRKPVFTCDIGESREIFQDERLFFRVSDSGSMAEKLLSLREDHEYELPDPALHSWEQRAMKLSAFLKNNM
jgi:glycosyltransferase involved in cell wall biosynthesis